MCTVNKCTDKCLKGNKRCISTGNFVLLLIPGTKCHSSALCLVPAFSFFLPGPFDPQSAHFGVPGHLLPFPPLFLAHHAHAATHQLIRPHYLNSPLNFTQLTSATCQCLTVSQLPPVPCLCLFAGLTVLIAAASWFLLTDLATDIPKCLCTFTCCLWSVILQRTIREKTHLYSCVYDPPPSTTQPAIMAFLMLHLC